MLIVILGLIDIAAGIMLFFSNVPFIPEDFVFFIVAMLMVKGGLSLLGQIFH